MIGLFLRRRLRRIDLAHIHAEIRRDTSDTRSCDQVAPEIGVTSTPVIDRTRGANGVVYVIAMSKDGSGKYHQRLHALDLALGAELFSGPMEVQAKYPGTGDNSDGTNVIFDPGQYKERSAAADEWGPLHRLVIALRYRALHRMDHRLQSGTLAQTAVLNVTPNGFEGAIWMAGAGWPPTIPGTSTSSTPMRFDTTLNSSGFPANGDYGNAFLKISTSTASPSPIISSEHQHPRMAATSTSARRRMVLPDLSDGAGHTLHLAVGAGKVRTSML